MQELYQSSMKFQKQERIRFFLHLLNDLVRVVMPEKMIQMLGRVVKTMAFKVASGFFHEAF